VIRELPAGSIPLRPVEPGNARIYRLFVLSSLALAGLAGFVLGINVPLERLLNAGSASRTADMIQAHGQVQLLGFAGLFVMGMSLRLMPRFASSKLQFEALLLPIWALIVASLITRALVMVWLPDAWHSALDIAVQFSLLLAAGGYVSVVFATLLVDRDDIDATSCFFLGGAAFYFLQAALAAFIAIKQAPDDTRVFAYIPDMALLYLQLAGFLMAFVGGVATRAIPSMSGLPRPDAGGKRSVLALAVCVVMLSAPLVWLAYGGASLTAVRLSDAGLAGTGLCFFAIVFLSGALRPAANRVRPASQPHMRLVKAAFLWLTFAGVLAVYFGSKAFVRGELPSFYELDSFRHSVALGTLTALILGMGLMILPEFAAQRQNPNSQTRLSAILLVLVTSAAVLRVGSGLLGTAISPDQRDLILAVGGLLAEAAILLFGGKLIGLTLSS
jgi:hypothetical protein